MSKKRIRMPNGEVKIEQKNLDECSWLIDDICCNSKSGQYCYSPEKRLYCARCEYFEKED